MRPTAVRLEKWGLSPLRKPPAAQPKTCRKKFAAIKASAGQTYADSPSPCVARCVDDSDWCEVLSCDFLVIGSGIAGLSYALKVAEHGKVIMVSKETANEGSTAYAQGGISAVFGKDDSVESHIQDTMRAGGYLNTYEYVLLLVLKCWLCRKEYLGVQRIPRAFTGHMSNHLVSEPFVFPDKQDAGSWVIIHHHCMARYPCINHQISGRGMSAAAIDQLASFGMFLSLGLLMAMLLVCASASRKSMAL